MQTNRYQDLVAWQKAVAFVKHVYAVTAQFPAEELFGLKSQMRRAAVSVPSNIAEGQGRATAGEFHQFLGHARGSLYEVETQVVIASELGYLAVDERHELLAEAGQVGRILNALKASLKPAPKNSASPQLTTGN